MNDQTQSLAASHVKTCRSQAQEPGFPEREVDCGLSSRESFAYYDHESSSWRTYQASLLQSPEESLPPLDAYLGSWPSAGMTRSGKAFRLRPLVPRSRGSGSSSSPTLRATETDQGCYQRDRGENGKERPTLKGVLIQLEDRGRTGTPTLSASGFGVVDVDRMLERRAELKAQKKNGNGFGLTLEQYMAVLHRPTPTLNAASGDKGPRKTATKAENGGHQVNLIDVTAHLSEKGGGVLNPSWCEWYMGFPVGWCDLPSEDLETSSSPRSPSGSAGK